jgi:predicted phosphodiesterase
MKIAVLTDAHANLPALAAALDALRDEGYDAIYHTGDAICIGPHPAECLDLLLNTRDLYPIMGNHDAWFAFGLPPQPEWVSDGEMAHQHWVHAQIDPALRAVVARWPYVVQERFAGVRVTLLHYEPADTESGFAPFQRGDGTKELDRLFGHRLVHTGGLAHERELGYAGEPADVVCFGHTHIATDLHGRRARYLNPGSLGCHREAVARFLVLECHNGRYAVEQRAVPYDDAPLWAAFEGRAVPERQFLYRAFFGGRFAAPST